MYRNISQIVVRFATFGVCAAAMAGLSGCGGFHGSTPPESISALVAKGSLYGGNQPIVGAHVYAFAVNTSGGYGSASTSLMTPGSAGTLNDSSGTYVTTDASGSFTYPGTITCPTPTTQVYLLALGGNAANNQPAASNSAIALMASVGDCQNISASTFTWINEVTTAAMAYALQNFAVDPIHIGAPASNTAGLLTAFKTAANLADSTSGKALAATPLGVGVSPQATLNTLANAVSACADSVSSSGAACSVLFTHTSATSGAPTTIFGALLNIAAFPAAQVANLYGDALLTSPFQPALTSLPNDFSLGITFSPGFTAVQPSAVVIDSAGHIWMGNCQTCLNPAAVDTLLEFSSTGALLHSYSGSPTPGVQILHNIKGIAIDASGTNVYTVNQGIAGGAVPGTGDDQIVKMSTSTGIAVVNSSLPIDFDQATYGVDTFQGIAVDSSGEIWATAANTGAIIEATPNGQSINGSPFFIGGTIGVAVDNIGNIWFAGTGGNNIVQFDTNGDFLQNFTPTGLNQPLNIAINGSNEILTINNGSNTLSRLEFFNGNNAGGSPYSDLGLFQASVTAVDGTNQVVIPNCRVSCPSSGSTSPDSLLRLSESGDSTTGIVGSNSGVEVSGFNGVTGAAIDAAGNVWVSNSVTGTLTQVIGFAAPTRQPLAAVAATQTIGQLP